MLLVSICSFLLSFKSLDAIRSPGEGVHTSCNPKILIFEKYLIEKFILSYAQTFVEACIPKKNVRPKNIF